MPHKMIEHIEQSPNGDDYREKLVAAEHGLRGDTVGITRIITMILALCWSLFQLASASILLLDTVYIRAIHLAFAISLVYFNIPMIKISGTSWRWDLRILLAMNRVTILDYLLGIIAAVSALYIVLDYEGIASRAGVPTTRDIIFGLMLVVLLLEATRRVIGPALPIIASIFILYVFTGPHLPDFLAFKGASLSRFISQMTMDTEGIYGVPLHVSATVVFLFVLFGTMLERAGGGNFFIQLAISGLGRFRGGAAKAAVLGSALTGVVSGSSIANVVTTGTFTIPLMKKVGYPPEKAAAVEVASSINGQLAPPVMGAAAFIIAEYVNVPPTSKSPRRPPSRPSPPMRACSGSPTWKLASSGCAACPNPNCRLSGPRSKRGCTSSSPSACCCMSSSSCSIPPKCPCSAPSWCSRSSCSASPS